MFVTAIDTAGVAENYDEILKLVDLVILDIKSIDADEYTKLVGGKIEKQKEFLDRCVAFGKKLWLRQVIVPGINDDEKHIEKLIHIYKKKCGNGNCPCCGTYYKHICSHR